MKNRNIVFIAIVTIVGIAGMSAYAISKNRDGEMMNDNKMMNSSSKSDAVVQPDKTSADYKMMAAVNGDEYDRLFLANMISHHQGAVDMANLALKNAEHQEVKDLAQAIVSAQTIEINSMVSWQATWGYPASSGTAMMDHSAMGMENTNAGMMNALNNKTGDDFDKAFLQQMIVHHRSAINMAVSGTNAQHQEVKDLTAAIITAQTKEVKEMKQWQKNWGYSN